MAVTAQMAISVERYKASSPSGKTTRARVQRIRPRTASSGQELWLSDVQGLSTSSSAGDGLRSRCRKAPRRRSLADAQARGGGAARRRRACSSCSTSTGTVLTSKLDLQALRADGDRRRPPQLSGAKFGAFFYNVHRRATATRTCCTRCPARRARRSKSSASRAPRRCSARPFAARLRSASTTCTQDPRYGTMGAAPRHAAGPPAGAQLSRRCPVTSRSRRSHRRPVLRPPRPGRVHGARPSASSTASPAQAVDRDRQRAPVRGGAAGSRRAHELLERERRRAPRPSARAR